MENKRKMINATSLRNGIILMSGVTNQLQVKSYFDSDTNTIQTITRWHSDFKLNREIDEDLKEVDMKQIEKLETSVKRVGWCINLVLILYSALIARNINYIMGALYYSFTCSKYLYVYIYQSFTMKVLNGTEKEVARYHSAEHMILNAYNKLERVPSLEEIKTFSRFSEYCGSRTIISIIIGYISISLAIAFSDKIHIIAGLLICIISIILSKKMLEKDFVKVEQILLTEPPTDLELEVAIKGLDTLLKEEEKIKKMMSITYVV